MKGQGRKRLISERFSGDSEYWQVMYSGKDYGRVYFPGLDMLRRREAVLAMMDRFAGGRSIRVLDVGSGPGVFMEELLGRGHRPVCLDISAGMIRAARELSTSVAGGSVPCLRGDVEQLPFTAASFQAVICIGVMQYLEEDGRALAELSRVLDRGGMAVISLPNLLRLNSLLDPFYAAKALRLLSGRLASGGPPGGEGLPPDNDTMWNRRYRYRQLARLMADNSLREELTLAVGFGPLTFWSREVMPQGLSRGLYRGFTALSRRRGFSWLNLFANRWVIGMRRV